MNWSYWKVINKQIGLLIIFLIFLTSIVWVSWEVINYKEIETTPSLFISLLSLIISGATSVITLMLPIFRKPIFELRIENQPFYSKSQDQNPSSWFHRLHVINHGLLPAENCTGKLIEIRDVNGKKVTKFDPNPFYWSHQNNKTEFKPITVFGRGDYAILDILQEKVVTKSDECNTFNDMKDWDRNNIEPGISNEFISATEDQFPSLRLHLADHEVFPNYEIHSVSPGTKPILIPGTYYLLIGTYAKNGFAKPEWYRLDIELSSKAEINSNLVRSKSTLKKATRAETRSFR